MLRNFYNNLNIVYNNLRANFFPVNVLKNKLMEKKLNTLELYANSNKINNKLINNKLMNSKIPFNEQWESKDFYKKNEK